MKTYLKSSFIFLILFAALHTGITGCSKSNDYNTTPTPTPVGTKGANEIWIQSSKFDATTLTVAVNTTVKWTNKDSFDHTVTSDSTMFDSGNLPAGGTFSYQFTGKGTFKYHCNYHAAMKGTIIVQ
jgi:plastocyanin